MYNQAHMLSKRVRTIINVVTIIALMVLLYFSWDQIQEGLRQIGGAKWSVVFLMIPMQLLNYYAIARLYHDYLKSMGETVKMSSMYKIALELNFVNHVFPSGGVAGFSYLGLRLRSHGVPVSRTTLAQTMRFAATFISFLIVLFFGMFLLSFSNQVGGVTLFIGVSITVLTIIGALGGVYIVSSESRIKGFTAFLPKLINKILLPITKKANSIDIHRIERLFVDLHKDYEIILKDKNSLKRVFLWALLINITEISTAYLAYIALGHLVNPGAVILAYAVASFAGLIAILPGGIGVYEALMTAVLTGAGVPKALALSATLVYRIFCMMIFLPIGFILYQIALRKGDAKIPETKI
jgi:uncharacterized protein (TIRG00374 family)